MNDFYKHCIQYIIQEYNKDTDKECILYTVKMNKELIVDKQYRIFNSFQIKCLPKHIFILSFLLFIGLSKYNGRIIIKNKTNYSVFNLDFLYLIEKSKYKKLFNYLITYQFVSITDQSTSIIYTVDDIYNLIMVEDIVEKIELL